MQSPEKRVSKLLDRLFPSRVKPIQPEIKRAYNNEMRFDMGRVNREIESDTFTKKRKIAYESSVRHEWINARVRCAKCPELATTVDHIVPESILEYFGYDRIRDVDRDNMQPMCKRCNLYKKARLDFTNPMTKTLLLKYLSKVPPFEDPKT